MSRSRATQRSAAGAAGDELSIDADSVSVTYADGTEAVADVTLRVPRGEFFGFLGPNGAGKTTTIKVLATLLEPTDGDVRINGFDVKNRRTAVRGTIGYMAQETSIDEELTARENLAFACDAYGVDGADRIEELLELVALSDVADTRAGTFSGGMKKRLDAATALVHDPDLVFLDEPTTGLDPKARNRLWEYFQRINDAGTTIFLTTQYLDEADTLCDRLAVIRDGSIVERGSPSALKSRVGGEILEVTVAGDTDDAGAAATVARQRDIFEPDAPIEATDGSVKITTQHASERGTDLLLALRDEGFDVREFTIHEATLDDVFLAIADEDATNLADAPPVGPRAGDGTSNGEGTDRADGTDEPTVKPMGDSA